MGLRAIILSALFACLMAVVNVYLGLKVGMTVSASIPCAVLAMLVLKIFKTSDIFESNLIQTAASAGESLAAGFIFTVPALLILGVWSSVDYWLSVIVLFSGGLLGILFSIPFRRVLFKRKELSYPEGRATADILLASQAGSGKLVLYGALVGVIVKFLQSGLGVLVETVQGVSKLGSWIFYGGVSLSPALLGVGYIVGLRVAISVFLGGVISWLIILPLMWESGAVVSLEAVSGFWSSHIRFIGVGAMSVGGAWTLFSVRDSFKSLLGMGEDKEAGQENMDLSKQTRLILFVISLFGIVYVVSSQVGSLLLSLCFVAVVLVSTFLFSVVSAIWQA